MFKCNPKLATILKILFCLILFQVSILYMIFKLIDTSHSSLNYNNEISENEIYTQEKYSYKSLPKWDYAKLFTMTNFTFILINPVCDVDKKLDLIIVVFSKPKNIHIRNAIRETWGSKRNNVKIFFLLGLVRNRTQQDVLEVENENSYDLLQGSFEDNNRNDPYKFIMALKYIVYYCPNVKYVLKIDEYLFVNMPVLIDFVQILNVKKNLMLCSFVDRLPWYRGFSRICYGYSILLTYDVIFRLYSQAQKELWLDDILFTEQLAKRLNVTYTCNRFIFMKQFIFSEFIKSNDTRGIDLFLLGPQMTNANEIRDMWSAIKSKYSKLFS